MASLTWAGTAAAATQQQQQKQQQPKQQPSDNKDGDIASEDDNGESKQKRVEQAHQTKATPAASRQLLHAVENDDVTTVNRLLEHKAHCAVHSTSGYSVLMIAAMRGFMDCLTSLLQQTGTKNKLEEKSTHGGFTALHLAVLQDKYDAAAALIEHKADVDALSGEDFLTPLQLAAANARTLIAKLLVRHNACATRKSLILGGVDYAALHFAAANNHAGMCDLLWFSHTALIQQPQTNRCRTPIMIAAHGGHASACARLVALSRGSSLLQRATRLNNKTALHFGAAAAHEATCSILLENKALPNARESSGRTPLAVAAARNDGDDASAAMTKATMGALLAHGATIDTHDHRGFTPLLIACEQRNARVATTLLDAKASVQLLDSKEQRYNPLIMAASRGSVVLCFLLCDRKALVNGRNSATETALMYAARAGHVEACHALIGLGAA
jgi:ankyrin repeat protein